MFYTYTSYHIDLFQKTRSFFIFFFFLISLSSQRSNSYHFTTSQGLPSNETYSVFEDSNNFIWIATDKGVSKYNGYEFINYTAEDGLGDNTIFNFYEDAIGRLWFLSYNGKLSYYLDGKINRVLYDISYNDIGHILSIYIDKNNTLWLGSIHGEFKAHFLSKNKLKVVPTKEQYSLRQIDNIGYIFSGNHFEENKEISYSVKLNNAVFLLKYSKNEIISPVKKINNDKRKNGINVNWLIHDGIIYNSNSYHALIFDQTTQRLNGIKFKFKGRATGTRIMKYKNNYVFYNSSLKKTYEILKKKPFITPPKISRNNLTSVIIDSQNGIWTSTLNKGVYYKPKSIIHTIASNKYDREAIVNMVSSDSVFFLRSKNNEIFKLTDNNNFQKIKSFPFDHTSGELKKFRNIIVYNDVVRGGIKPLNNNKTLPKFKKKSPFIASFKNDGFALYSRGDVSMYNKNNQLLYNYNFSKKKIVPKNVHYKNKNELYIASLQGLFEVNSSGRITFLGDKNPVFKTRIDKIEKDSLDRFWMITKEKGVFILKKNKVINITTSKGLLGNICTGLFIGKKRAWIATEKGLSGINLTNLNDIDNFTQKDGLISNQINDIHEYDDKVWVASDKGLSYFNIDYIQKTYPPETFIENVNLDGISLIGNDSLVIPSNNNILTIHYLGLSYREQGELKYKYRLKGLEPTWYTTKNRSVQYSTLPAGKYTFEIKAVNHQGIPSINPKTIHFTKKPHFWETLYFIIPLLILIFLITISIIYLRIRFIKKRAYLQHRIIKTELKLLRSQMNPHFTFNAMSSIQYYIQQNNTKKALRFIHEFSTLVRLILQHTQKETIFLNKEIDALKLYMNIEQERLKNRFSYHINILDVDVFTAKISPMLLQPYVENAIWHGIMHKTNNDGIISLNIYAEKNRTICEIIDNGIGRKASSRLKKTNENSLGMTLLEERLSLINTTKIVKQTVEVIDLTDTNNNVCGTKVKLTL